VKKKKYAQKNAKAKKRPGRADKVPRAEKQSEEYHTPLAA